MMDRLTTIRLAIAVVGVVMWGYGYATSNDGVRLAAIIILAISLVLRFLRPRPPEDTGSTG